MPPSSPKVAIPRLQRKSAEYLQPQRALRRRAARACQHCRLRKAKCDEATPTCGHCRDLQLDCRYESGKREKQKRQLEILSEKVGVYEKLLHDLSISADYASRLRIQTVLTKFSDRETIDSLLEPGSVSTPSGSKDSGMGASLPCMVGSAKNEIPMTENTKCCSVSSISSGQTCNKSNSDGSLTWDNSKRDFASSDICGDETSSSKSWLMGLPMARVPLSDNFTMNTVYQQTYNCPTDNALPWLGAIGFSNSLTQRPT